jgi:hypothetical protein
METIEMKILDAERHGAYAVSLVENPAMEEDFIYLSTEEIQLSFDEEKGLIYGVVMTPDKKILRQKPTGEKYNIFFSANTIEESAHLFLSRQQNNNVTLAHEAPTNGVSFVESWIVEDPKNDKSNALKLNAIKGSWILGAKITDEQIKADIKGGKFKGFSIEARYEKEDTLAEKLSALLDRFND